MNLTNEAPLNPAEFAERLAKTVKGQPEAIEYLSFIARIYDLKMRAEVFSFTEEDLKEFPRIVLMLTGATGGGKTFLIKEFAKQLKLPYTKLDCSQVTGDGWVGTSVSDVVMKHISKCKDGHGILHLDEFDKILPSNGTGSREGTESNFIASKMSSFLELLDGDFTATVAQRGQTPAANAPDLSIVNKTLIICSGSFQQVRDVEESSKKFDKNPIGFSDHTKEDKDEESSDWKAKMSELGYLKELAGRISHSLELKPYAKDDIIAILKDSDGSPYKKYLNMFGKGSTITDEELDTIAEAAADSQAGLRILNSLLFEAYFKKGVWKWKEKPIIK